MAMICLLIKVWASDFRIVKVEGTQDSHILTIIRTGWWRNRWQNQAMEEGMQMCCMPIRQDSDIKNAWKKSTGGELIEVAETGLEILYYANAYHVIDLCLSLMLACIMCGFCSCICIHRKIQFRCPNQRPYWLRFEHEAWHVIQCYIVAQLNHC